MGDVRSQRRANIAEGVCRNSAEHGPIYKGNLCNECYLSSGEKPDGTAQKYTCGHCGGSGHSRRTCSKAKQDADQRVPEKFQPGAPIPTPPPKGKV